MKIPPSVDLRVSLFLKEKNNGYDLRFGVNVPPKFLKRLILQRFEYCLNFPFLSVTLSEKRKNFN
jgi:hypothetical protein